ncbi:LytR family transcriptional regulator, partial [Candidatus Peribacteria bacterium]|nr:LytR family transcriptional regulator [Candidatus Peribacteria bacterium]
DLYFLSTEKMGKGRVNSLYRDYKAQLIRKGTERSAASAESMRQLAVEIGKALGLEVHGTIKLNFSGFVQTIDAIGGIDIDVPEDLVDPEYPGPNYTYEEFRIGKGLQHLDGATALKYARSRHSTSDFSRSARQQQIIVAASEKAKDLGLLRSPRKVSDVMNIISKNMETTFQVRELLGFADIGKKVDRQNIVSMQLSDVNGLFGGLSDEGGFLYAPPREEFDGAAVFLPVSIPEFPVTWKQIQFLVTLLTTNREAFIDPPTILIANAGAKEGSARLLGAELTRYGFNVIKTRNFGKPNTPFDRSWMSVRQDNTNMLEPTLSLLADLFDFTEMKTPPEGSFGEENPDLLIVLGKDYRYTPLQDLIR